MDDNAAREALLEHAHREGNVYVLDEPRCPEAIREAVQAWGRARGWLRSVADDWQLRVPADRVE